MNAMYRDLGLLLMRVGFGGVILTAHGWSKLAGFSEKMHAFGDPLGLGSPATLALAVFAEFFCAFAVVIGLGTRIAAIPLVATMGTAAFIVHAPDPFQKSELALLYFVAFAALILTGGGRFSVDSLLEKLRLKRASS